MTLQVMATTAHWIGLGIYGAILTTFALAATARSGSRQQVLMAYQKWGALLGLSMGAIIFGGIGIHLLEYGLHWPPEADPNQHAILAKYAVFALLWFSSFHLEIWTLEPLRRSPDGHGGLAISVRRATRQLQANAALFHVVGLITMLHLR